MQCETWLEVEVSQKNPNVRITFLRYEQIKRDGNNSFLMIF